MGFLGTELLQLRATPEGGVITLRAETQEDDVLFLVSDNGPGISETDVPHLFERYWRKRRGARSRKVAGRTGTL